MDAHTRSSGYIVISSASGVVERTRDVFLQRVTNLVTLSDLGQAKMFTLNFQPKLSVETFSAKCFRKATTRDGRLRSYSKRSSESFLAESFDRTFATNCDPPTRPQVNTMPNAIR